jgi:NTE family protein
MHAARTIAAAPAWLLAAGLLAAAQALAQQPAETARPKIGLVLSGGGARGLAHIGVLRVLEEQRIAVDAISATSMGAIVGGAYAAGATPAQLREAALAADWDELLAGRPPRAELHWRRKEDDGKNLAQFEFGIGRDGLSLPSGAIAGTGLERFLRGLTDPVQDVNNLRRLPIPFVAMATDLETGAAVELNDMPLSQAMRASMSIPGAYAPVQRDGRLLVDGGLVANIPVQPARKLGAEILIVVNVGTPLAPRRELGTAFGAAQQMLNILTEQNVAAAKRELRPGDVLIEPDFGRLTASDFTKAAQIIELGERAARDALARLQPLALGEAAYAGFEARRTARTGGEVRARVAQVRVEGLARTNPATVRAQIDLPPDRYVDAGEIRDAMREVNAERKFERVDYRLETIGADRVLAVQPVEKSWGPHTLRLGGQASTDFHDEHIFNLLVAHTLTDFNAWGAEWRNEVQLGESMRLLSDLYQPLAPGSRWFALPQLQWRRTSVNVFDGDNVVGRAQTTATEATLLFGHTLPRLGYAALGRTQGRLRVEALIAPAPQPAASASTDRWTGRVVLDRIDSYAFPRHGYVLGLEHNEFDDANPDGTKQRLTAANLLAAWTSGRSTLLVNAYGVRGTRDGLGGQLGGFLNLSGTPRGRYAGSRTVFGSLIGYREISDLVGELPSPVYVGASLEAGNSDDAPGSTDWNQLKRAGSLFIAADTLIGPIYLAYGVTRHGRGTPYLFWGRF